MKGGKDNASQDQRASAETWRIRSGAKLGCINSVVLGSWIWINAANNLASNLNEWTELCSAPGLEEQGDPGTARPESTDDNRNSRRVRVRSEVLLPAVASGWFYRELYVFQPVLFLPSSTASKQRSQQACVFAQGQTQLCCHCWKEGLPAEFVPNCKSTKQLKFQETGVLSMLLWIQHRISKPTTLRTHLVLSAAALLPRLASPATLFILHSLKLNLEMKVTLFPSGKGSRGSPCCNKPWGGRNSI